MIVKGLTFQDLREGIKPVLAEWNESVVPAEVELLPHSRYSPRYAWMFAFEKRLKYRIEKTVGRPLSAMERLLFGPDGVFSEGLSNAFVHGHRRDPERSIEVRCSVGEQGLVFCIKDQGNGFDVDRVVNSAIGGGRYAKFGGNGLRVFNDRRSVTGSYSDGGRGLHLQVLFADASGDDGNSRRSVETREVNDGS